MEELPGTIPEVTIPACRPGRIFLLFSADSSRIVLRGFVPYRLDGAGEKAAEIHLTRTIIRRPVMEHTVTWEKEMKTALSLAETTKKPILLDFFNPG